MKNLVLLLLLLLLVLPMTGYAEVKIIEVKHRPAADLVAQVRTLLDDGEKIESAGSHLVLIANGESLKAAEKMIGLLDTVQRNLLIRVRQSEQRQQVGSDMSAAVHYGTDSKGNLNSGYQLGNTNKVIEQRLQLVEGSRGLIEIGREIPFTKQWAAVTGDISGFSAQNDYKTVATGFWVAPMKVIGEQVLVDVEPYVSAASRQGRTEAPQIDFSRLRTRLQVPLGQWYPLGSQLQHRDKVSKAIISWSTDSDQADRQLEIRIDPAD